MKPLRIRTASEQVAEHLRRELLKDHWGGACRDCSACRGSWGWGRTPSRPRCGSWSRRSCCWCRDTAAVGPNQPQALAALTDRLVRLGHRRIVLITRPARRLSEPGPSERAFLETLAAAGVATGSYNLPDWEETLPGLQSTQQRQRAEGARPQSTISP